MNVDDIDPDTRLISGSEVATFQKCQMQWWFAFRVHLAPKKLSDGLFIGTMGHEALSNYYKVLKVGGSQQTAETAMFDFVEREFDRVDRLKRAGILAPIWAVERDALITRLEGILRNYLVYYKDDLAKYKVVEVEQMHVSGNFFAMRLDLLLREVESGCLVLMDHKFVRDFYLEKQLRVNSQLPKYMKIVIGDREEKVSHGLLNQIRNRLDVKDEEKMFSRARIDYKEIVAAKRTRDQELVASQIRGFYKMTKREAREKVIRVVSDYTCKFCAFALPCALEEEGREKEFRNELNINYEMSDYGYNG